MKIYLVQHGESLGLGYVSRLNARFIVIMLPDSVTPGLVVSRKLLNDLLQENAATALLNR